MKAKRTLLCVFFIAGSIYLSYGQGNKRNPYYSRTDTATLAISNEEWQEILPSDLFHVARLGETERAFTGKYNTFDVKGTYYCAVCGNALFLSTSKFSSTCGWPSFFEPLRADGLIYKEDFSHGIYRVEVRCGRCASHLGHVFDDGPAPTGKRYCMNSISLEFEPRIAK
ncbi:peptide-methionine (R)-S-oxide reductase MsrB [Sphingobacterium sp. JB170]|uniref:peptide-methionine (R)-S-oxide reductase MsrB n=1 Tax=Sphingobacterium sp. JB170 TaxID=1434842 RepID=UPI00097E9D25|nr:peptide-methionine (R)-S-oxide reductase MsrB [Sphingobacterium sp. JB170]SJN19780.1 Peptide methionine sulfoxide reductase MsrB [Sphingobacterium sp. JB170]